MICALCGKSLESLRRGAKYCSPACRYKAFKLRRKSQESQTEALL